MSYGPLKKPTMAHLTLLNWMHEHPELRMVYLSDPMGSGTAHWAYADGKRYNWNGDHNGEHLRTEEEVAELAKNEPAPTIPKTTAFHRLTASSWLQSVTLKSDSVWGRAHRYRLTTEGRELVEEYKDEYATHVTKLDAERQRVDRLIIVSNLTRYGDKRQFAALCRVVRETKKRIYVERVDVKGDKPKTGWHSDWVPSIEGRVGNEYITRDVVAKDNVTIAEYRIMRTVEDNHRTWLNDLKEQEGAELDEIRDRYDARRDQNQYAYEDELREALEKVKKNDT